MQIYDHPVRVLLANMIHEYKASGKNRFETSDAIQWFEKNYPLIKEGTIRAHLRRFSTNDPNRLYYSNKPGEGLLFKLVPSDYRMSAPENDPPEILAPPNDDTEQAESAIQPPEFSSEFAYERDLQRYLAKNLHAIETGLRLWEDEDGSINGIEFDVGGRRIDILAIDKDDNLVVIELKVSRGYDRVIGQLLRYMAWIEKHQASENQSVRGVIIAREISDDLKLATSKISDVELFEYTLSVELSRVD